MARVMTMKRRGRTGVTTPLNNAVQEFLKDKRRHSFREIYDAVGHACPRDLALKTYKEQREYSGAGESDLPEKTQVQKGRKRAIQLACIFLKYRGILANGKGRGMERKWWLV